MRKEIMAALAALCLGTTLALGLPQASLAAGGGKHAGGKRLQKMADTLALTDAQKAQIKPLLMSVREQTKAVKADTSLSPADRKAKMKAIRESMKSQLMPILTTDQKAKLAAARHHTKKNAPTAAA